MRLSDAERKASSPAFQQRAHQLYEEIDEEIDDVTAKSAAHAEDEAARADQIVDTSAVIVALIAAVGMVLAVIAMRFVEVRVSRPLARISGALTALAAGQMSAEVPPARTDDEIGELTRAFTVFRANSIALEEAHRSAEEAHLREQALARHDSLTGLTNRRVLSEELQRALARAHRFGSTFAVLLIDLDRFKPVNDIYGHSAGDAVLLKIASRMRDIVRRHDTISRIGGDEFAIVCTVQGNTEREVITLAERVLEAVRTPIPIPGGEVMIDGSIGIALGPVDGGGSGGASESRGHRDVPVQGSRSRNLPLLRAQHGRGAQSAHRAGRKRAPGCRAQGGQALLPAAHRSRHHAAARLRDPGALDASATRRDPAPRSSSRSSSTLASRRSSPGEALARDQPKRRTSLGVRGDVVFGEGAGGEREGRKNLLCPQTFAWT